MHAAFNCPLFNYKHFHLHKFVTCITYAWISLSLQASIIDFNKEMRIHEQLRLLLLTSLPLLPLLLLQCVSASESFISLTVTA